MLVVMLLTGVIHDAGSILAEVIQLDGEESKRRDGSSFVFVV